MAFKDFDIKRNRCRCHPETCACNRFNFTYKGKKLASNYDREPLEDLLKAIQSEIKLGQRNARSNENKRMWKELGSIDWPHDRHNY